MTDLLRSHVEFSKRVVLDRLTTDEQPLQNHAQIDQGPGDDYVYGGVGDARNFGTGFDCSGLDGVALAIAIFGPDYFAQGYKRLFSTETFPGPLPGFRQTSRADAEQSHAPLKVYIHHGGGGPNSHMACSIDGMWVESNGSHGISAYDPDITGPDYWNDWWVWDAPIVEDTTWRQPMSYPKGFDYAGGRPSGAAVKAAGASFVCRYLTDGSPNLPSKQLVAGELADLVANGVAVVFNYETTATFMLGGADAGKVCAAQALTYIHAIGGPLHPVVYFSADWDESPDQQDAVNQFLTAAAQVLGGPQFVGVYGAYYLCQRALDAGVCKYMWQTEAWSGGNIDARVNIMQRNSIGYANVAGTQCDIDEAHTDDFGQYAPWNVAVPQPPAPVPPTSTVHADEATMISQMYDQICGTWPELGKRADGKSDRTLVDGIAHLIGDVSA